MMRNPHQTWGKIRYCKDIVCQDWLLLEQQAKGNSLGWLVRSL